MATQRQLTDCVLSVYTVDDRLAQHSVVTLSPFVPMSPQWPPAHALCVGYRLVDVEWTR